MENVESIRNGFEWLSMQNKYVVDKSGVRMLELIGETFVADKNTIFGTVSPKYVEKELRWYISQSLRLMDDPPEVWKKIASRRGEVNSNYGWCIYSSANGLQYFSMLQQLIDFKQTRRAIMIYTRPEMQADYNRDGMSDFMCTNTVQAFIRDNALTFVVNQRSMDAVYGYKNDRAWHQYVMDKAIEDLRIPYPSLEHGEIIFQVGSLHLYEKHFHYITDKEE